MPPPDDVKLGPLTQKIVTGSRWLEQDAYPAHQSWADESERLLSFLRDQGQFDKFFARLTRQNAEHRTAALAEARTAWFLHCHGFDILAWEPGGLESKVGDLVVRYSNSGSIFVEVKGPHWKGELTREIKSAPPDEKLRILERIKREKYITGDARFVDPVGAVLDVIDRNAVPKLADDRSNLIVVVDDLFTSPVGSVGLEYKFNVAFTANDKLKRVGAVLLISPQTFLGERDVMYRCAFFANPSSLDSCALPPEAVVALQSAADESAAEYAEMRTRSHPKPL